MKTDGRALARILSGCKEEEQERKEERKRDLVTLNLLGGNLIGVRSKDLNLDFWVSPSDLENSNNLMSNKMHPSKPSPALAHHKLQDLNLPPGPNDVGDGSDDPQPEDSASLDLNLMTPVGSEHPTINTLKNVKSTLEQAKCESQDKAHQEGIIDGSPSPSLVVVAKNSSMKRHRGKEAGGQGEEGMDGSDLFSGSLMAAGCPNCLLYVLVAKQDPHCPQCGSHVPTPAFYKKPRV